MGKTCKNCNKEMTLSGFERILQQEEDDHEAMQEIYDYLEGDYDGF